MRISPTLAVSFPVETSHRWTAPSRPRQASVLPSPLRTRPLPLALSRTTRAAIGVGRGGAGRVEVAQLLAAVAVPHLGDVVLADRQHRLAVGQEGRQGDGAAGAGADRAEARQGAVGQRVAVGVGARRVGGAGRAEQGDAGKDARQEGREWLSGRMTQAPWCKGVGPAFIRGVAGGAKRISGRRQTKRLVRIVNPNEPPFARAGSRPATSPPGSAPRARPGAAGRSGAAPGAPAGRSERGASAAGTPERVG